MVHFHINTYQMKREILTFSNKIPTTSYLANQIVSHEQQKKQISIHAATVLAHQKAVQFFHPMTQQQKGNDPSAETAYQQRQGIKIVPQNSRCRANDCHAQKDKGTNTSAVVVREIIKYHNSEIHAEYGVYPQAQHDEHM